MPQFPWVPTEAPKQPRCSLADVEASWWGEPDLDRHETGLAKANEDNMRAKLFCYECPLIAVCRKAAWDEPGCVWGGLDPTERWNLRRGHQIPTNPPPMPRKGVAWGVKFGQVLSTVRTQFLNGCSTEAIARNMNLSGDSVRRHVTRLLLEVRSEREAAVQWQSPAPRFHRPMTRRQYLYGQAVLSDSEDLMESA